MHETHHQAAPAATAGHSGTANCCCIATAQHVTDWMLLVLTAALLSASLLLLVRVACAQQVLDNVKLLHCLSLTLEQYQQPAVQLSQCAATEGRHAASRPVTIFTKTIQGS